jgi:anaerobic selenocysteine-containing dehydrogenase
VAYDLIARELNALDSPDRALFYTSGRTSNEAAFVSQLFVRAYGTNNLPDCSNMCHESSGFALKEVIGVGKGSVSLEDLVKADLILIVGENPGSNHPRMLATLEEAKRAGVSIVSVNPLPDSPRTPHGIEDYAAPCARSTGTTCSSQPGCGRRRSTSSSSESFDPSGSSSVGQMGITQHKNAVRTIREIVNFLLLRGNMGRPGAGVCPVRGHTNVQGDRTMGIWERPSDAWLDATRNEFGFEPPRHHGYDVVESIVAMRDGYADVFMAVVGNFVSAAPDTEVTKAGLRRYRLPVQVSTKLNRSHAVAGREALILSTLGRTEIDRQRSGPQFVTVEDSMSERYRERVAVPSGFVLAHSVRDRRRFDTTTGKANFTVNELTVLRPPPGRLILQTLRSHYQFNTTIYGLDDRYRGIEGGRHVVFVSPPDLAQLGLSDGQYVDLVSEWSDGVSRRATGFQIVSYPTARGCAAAYYPETNVLVPLESAAHMSNQPSRSRSSCASSRGMRPDRPRVSLARRRSPCRPGSSRP